MKIYCDTVTDELWDVARMISKRQQEVVEIITPTETFEVQYEKVSEMQDSESEEPQQ